MSQRSTARLAMARSGCVLALLLTSIPVLWAQTSAPQPASSRVPQPVIETARGGVCVEDPAFMRRNHMTLLMHQRDDTLRAGLRTGKYSLKACIACHASQTSQSVNAEPSNFCQSCHSYAAVKIDCFECHASKPTASTAMQQAKP